MNGVSIVDEIDDIAEDIDDNADEIMETDDAVDVELLRWLVQHGAT